jgi:pyridoxal phosphate enzyme (YggS family)
MEALEAAIAAGLRDLGENRVDELEEKVGCLGRHAATWHMIGHVQGRKAARTVEIADLVHSVDTLRLAERISRAAGEAGRRVRVLAQVNASGEESKSGFDVAEAVEQTLRMAELPGLRVDGLMTMAPFVDDEEVLSSAFRVLRETLDEVRASDPRVGPELSMGMTNDLEIAVREGSTMVRIGTALFGERPAS